MTKPTDEEIDAYVEKLAIYSETECKTAQCRKTHQRIIDALEWVRDRRKCP